MEDAVYSANEIITKDASTWDDILNAIEQRRSVGYKTSLFSESDGESEAYYLKIKKRLDRKKRYTLGTQYPQKYFTKREAECMVLLLKGNMIDCMAKRLKLSPRTIEYYLKNMKAKVDCRTKFELIDLINTSEFMQYVDFQL